MNGTCLDDFVGCCWEAGSWLHAGWSRLCHW